MKAWKRYTFYIIGVQLFVFSLLSMKQHYFVNEEVVEEKLSDSPPHIASVGQKGTKNTRVNFNAGKIVSIMKNFNLFLSNSHSLCYVFVIDISL